MSDYYHLSDLCDGYGYDVGCNPSYMISRDLPEEGCTEECASSGLASKIAGVSPRQLQELFLIVFEDTKRENQQETGTQQ